VDLTPLADHGFDIVHAFDANAAAREPGLGVLAGAQRLGLLIGNTRALWPKFLAARDPEDRDPLEHYTERVIGAAFADARILYSHRRYASEPPGEPSGREGAFFPFQRLAVTTGLGALSEGGLVIHPSYGPWFALRAVVLVDGDPVERAPIAKPCTCDARCGEALQVALADRRDWRKWLDVRNACKLGAARYSDDQIRYHYLKVF
jgi:Methylmalonic aciduria and homocystinuria type C family